MKYVLAIILGLSVLGAVTALGYAGMRHPAAGAKFEAIVPLEMMSASKGLKDETVPEAF